MTARMTTSERRAITLGANDRVALIAGSGQLPVDVAASLSKAGTPPLVIIIGGEAVERGQLETYKHRRLTLEELGELMPLLKKNRITHLVMAGGVSNRPRLAKIKWNLSLMRFLPKIAYALARGDNTVLSTIVAHFEKNGIKVVGPHEIVPDLLARQGPMTATRPKAADRRDIDAAREAALSIGKLDIGQAAIAIGGRVVAVEGIEGTDGLLERTRDLRQHGRIAGTKRGVLVKYSKPGQEVRADLPTIGPATIDGAHAAGLAGVAVEAGRTFVLDFGRTIERADALGLFVVGLPQAGS